ncbi:MAG: hypothetical protein Fur0018_18300 [Anaerolineales bacterium]
MNIPEKFGRYLVKDRLGRGGMATVYLANDPRFQREVAIKILPLEMAADDTFRQRFEREARAIAALEHPAIVPVYDFADENGQPYIVMRLMKGGSLAERLKNGALSPIMAGRILDRLAQALDAAHQRGIIHRDLKPGNILFDEYDNAYLSDFGIAHVAGAGSTLTGTGIIGTPAYMSPEQVQGSKDIDARSDVYALGIILYQMLSGQTPFQADTPARVMMAHILEEPASILSLQPDLPPECEPILKKALAKDREQRYNSAGELAADFNALLRATVPTPTAGSALPPAAATLKAAIPIAAETLEARPSTPTSAARKVHAEPQAAPPPQKSALPLWGIIGSGILLLGLLVVGGWLLSANLRTYRATPPPSQTLLAGLVHQTDSVPTADIPPSPSPTPSPSATPAPSETPLPTPSQTPTPSETPTPTPTATAAPLVLGGADEIAFLRDSDIWVVGLDGRNLRQLTKDGGEKNLLQWTPDAQAITYILGTCVHSVEAESGRDEILVCLQAIEYLEDFRISPDGTQFAISIDRKLYVAPFARDALAQVRLRTDIQRMGTCKSLSPYERNAVKEVRWSADGTKLALKIIGNANARQVDLVDVVLIKNCPDTPPRVDEFPAQRFTIKTYDKTPIIQNFSWDGIFLFALTGYTRNDGFGDLYIYNSDLHKADLEINPVDGICCYRDPHFSPDGQYLAFAFQDLRAGADNPITLYYINATTIGTGVHYQPIPLPDGFFGNPREKPQPIPRPQRP